MKINVEDFADFLKNNSWDTYASETKDNERLRLFYNANGFYRVTKGNEVIYFGSNIGKAVDTYNTFSN